MISTLEADGGFGHHWNDMRKLGGRNLCQIGGLEFTFAIGDLLRGYVHGFAEVPRGYVPYKAPG